MKDQYKNKILIVDDSMDNLDLIEDMLNDEGYEDIICVMSAREAYEKLKSSDIDLIILDIMMPGINGIEACRCIKANESYKDIPIIIATAKVDLETLKEGFDAGANDYIRKPIVNDIELLSRVKNALKLKASMDKYKELAENLDEKVRQELEKNRFKEQLLMHQSKMASMGEMIGNIAHQWRQPLSALSLSVQKVKMLHEKDKLDTQILKQATEKSLMLIERMSGTIDDFMGFFRQNKARTPFDVQSATEETLTLLDASLQHNCIEYDFIESDGKIVVEGHKGEFSQVILNILSNAKDILKERKIKNPKIEIEVSLDEENVTIEIKDNGGGVPVEIIDRIFEPYFTTKEEGKGTGIGLYMSKVIIEKNMGGGVGVRNEENGALFWIKLPYKAL
ncbi:response regulator [Hydrogenimonas sp.]